MTPDVEISKYYENFQDGTWVGEDHLKMCGGTERGNRNDGIFSRPDGLHGTVESAIPGRGPGSPTKKRVVDHWSGGGGK